jgi:hypothetical protein
MYKRIILGLALITVLLLCSCSPIKRVETREIEANIDYVYYNEKTDVYGTMLEYGGEVTIINNKQFYNYCKSRVGETIPAILTMTFYINFEVSYVIMPDLERIINE